jgi:predicted N-acyltransferase
VVQAAIAAVGGVSFPLTTRWRLPVRWDSWDDYLAGFTRRRVRKILRELRAAAESGLHPGQVDLDRYADRVVEGRCALLRHYGQPADEDGERVRLRGLAAAFGTSLLVYGALRDGADPVASVVCVRHDRVVRVVYAATVDEARVHYPGAHFLAGFYAPAQALTHRDTDEIDYGIGHGPSKSARGCRPQLTYGHAVAVSSRAEEALELGARLLAECGPPERPATDHPAGDQARRGDEGGQ